MSKIVVGLYERFENAQNAVDELVRNGFRRENISLVMADTEGKFRNYAEQHEQGEDITDGAAAGAGIGAALGGLGGLLVGLGVLAIPGIGPVLAAGPIAAALAGAGIGAVTGGLVGALVDLGIPDEQANLYAEGVRRGGTLVTVTVADEDADTAVDILNRYNPVDVNERSEQWRSQQWQRFDENAPSFTSQEIEQERARYAGQERMQGEDATFEVVEEDLAVGKRQVPEVGVRIHTYVTEKPVEKNVNLRKEHIDVERHRVDRPASEADLRTFEEGEFEVTATSEEPVVEKRARVVEEVEVHKDVHTEQETIRDTLRRKDVEVENLDRGEVHQDLEEYEPMFRTHYQSTYSQMGRNYDEMRPAYYYGYELANDPRFRDKDWDEVRETARRDWERRHQDTLWDDIQDAVHEGWMRVKSAF